MLNKIHTLRTLLLTVFVTALAGMGAWAQTFTVLHAFGNAGDGLYPIYGLVFDGQGNLYGVTPYGPSGYQCGGEGCGTAYVLKPNPDKTWTESVIHVFSDTAGSFPSSSLIRDAQGNLYGSACGQGRYPDVVYQLMPGANGSWTESALYQFPPSSFGSFPGELTLDAAGNVFGTTRFGGANQTGTVFSLDRSSGWQESLLFTFDGYPYSSGGGAQGAITFDSAGTLYGTTLGGGAHNAGVVYKLTHQGVLWRQTVLYSFAGGRDGDTPVGVIFGSDGNLYGVTQVGGFLGTAQCFSGCGTVFKLSPQPDGTWTKTTLYAFRGGSDGALPVNRVVFDQAGNIYSTTSGGGNTSCSYGCGTVFKLTPSSGGQWTESILYSFTGGLDGFNPDSPLAIDGAGNLYGTVGEGGLYRHGVAYKIVP